MFSKKSRIEDIVEGTTSDINYNLYKKILEKAKSYSINQPNVLAKGIKKFTTVFNDCSNRFNQTCSSEGFKLNNPFLQTYNR